METRRWINQSQPQTLYFACVLLYIDAVFAVLRLAFLHPLGLAIVAGTVGAAWGIANEKKWAYVLGIVVSALALVPYVMMIAAGDNPIATAPIGLMFAVAQLALLLHPQSREYQRIWFK